MKYVKPDIKIQWGTDKVFLLNYSNEDYGMFNSDWIIGDD